MNPIRGTGSFKESDGSCDTVPSEKYPFGLKSIVSNINKNELDDLVILGATMGRNHHNFIALLPTPR